MPYNDGVLYSELSDFQKDLLNQANYIFPKEYVKFLKTEGGKLKKIQQKIAKAQVGEDDSNNEVKTVTLRKRNGKTYTKKVKKDYHDCFKRGKVYDFNGTKCVRAYNSARHAHLIEFGHKKYIRGKDTGEFVAGRHVMKQAEYEFTDDFTTDAEKFLFEHFENFKGSRV